MASPTQRFHLKKTRAVQVPCTVSSVVREKSERPCLIYMDITFPEPSKLNFLTFRNYYTASICVKHKEPNGEWSTVLPNYKLMKSCHGEMDAQGWHTLDVFKMFVRTFDCFRVSMLRVYLTQPSPHWSSFALQDVQAYAVAEVPAEQPPAALNPATLAAATDVLTLAQSIKIHRAEYSRYDKFSKYLDKVPLEAAISQASGSEITELR